MQILSRLQTHLENALPLTPAEYAVWISQGHVQNLEQSASMTLQYQLNLSIPNSALAFDLVLYHLLSWSSTNLIPSEKLPVFTISPNGDGSQDFLFHFQITDYLVATPVEGNPPIFNSMRFCEPEPGPPALKTVNSALNQDA